MDVQEAIRTRHSVRSYTDRPLDPESVAALQAEIDAANAEGDLNIRLVTDEDRAFTGLMSRLGGARWNVRNYLVLAGPESDDLEERIGYYGERVVLRATMLGIDSCWVALTFRKGEARRAVGPDDKLVCVVSLGYGTAPGAPHKSRPLSEVCRADGPLPDWFERGMEAALLAPTALNQQKFLFTLVEEDRVQAEALKGSHTQVDLGIAKYHFEVGAGAEHFAWA